MTSSWKDGFLRDVDGALVVSGGVGGGGAADSQTIDAATEYGVVADGTTSQLTKLNDARDAALAAGKALLLPPGVIAIDDVWDCRADFLTILGTQTTVIRQKTSNKAVMRVGGAWQHIEGVQLDYASAQPAANTAANAMEFDHAVMSTFRRIRTKNSGRGLYLMQSGTTMGSSTTNNLYSCTFDNIQITGYSLCGIHLESVNSNSTGNSWSDIYVKNDFTGSIATATEGAISLKNTDEDVFNQLNVEWTDIVSNDVIRLNQAKVVFNSLHFEQVGVDSGSFGLIRPYDHSRVLINGMDVQFSRFPGGTPSVFRVGIDSEVYATGGMVYNNTVGASSFALVDYFGETVDSNVEVNGFNKIPDITALVTNEPSPAATRRVNDAWVRNPQNVVLTQAEYDALVTPDPNTVYLING